MGKENEETGNQTKVENAPRKRGQMNGWMAEISALTDQLGVTPLDSIKLAYILVSPVITTANAFLVWG